MADTHESFSTNDQSTLEKFATDTTEFLNAFDRVFSHVRTESQGDKKELKRKTVIACLRLMKTEATDC